FATLKLVFNSTAAGFQTYWFIESLVTQTLVVLIIRSPRAFTKSLPSKPLLASIAGVILLALAIIFSPLGRYFGFVQPTLAPMLVISLITLSYLVVVRIVSLLMVRHNELIK
ncbi:cation transporting ATPase C-terminal domain-containing protein, partial [Candidatus Saccharibacteria bacterium]|nr:cation transporting ATPase C-terminal domain-containing protein [Candidatus Saccharibacteria bacterium]